MKWLKRKRDVVVTVAESLQVIRHYSMAAVKEKKVLRIIEKTFTNRDGD